MISGYQKTLVCGRKIEKEVRRRKRPGLLPIAAIGRRQGSQGLKKNLPSHPAGACGPFRNAEIEYLQARKRDLQSHSRFSFEGRFIHGTEGNDHYHPGGSVKKTRYRIGKDCCYDVVLCTTGNRRVDRDVTGALWKHEISFTKSEKRPSLIQRMRRKAPENIFVISVNRNEYFKARHALSTLSPGLQKRLCVNAI